MCERHGSAFAEIDQKLTHYSLSLNARASSYVTFSHPFVQTGKRLICTGMRAGFFGRRTDGAEPGRCRMVSLFGVAQVQCDMPGVLARRR